MRATIIVRVLGAAGLAAVFAGGCRAVLGIEEGRLRLDTEPMGVSPAGASGVPGVPDPLGGQGGVGSGGSDSAGNGLGGGDSAGNGLGGDGGGGATPLLVTINEIESGDGVPGDWVELYNAGADAVDLTGFIFMDSDIDHIYALPENTQIAPGGFLVIEEEQFDFGLGSNDTARLFYPDGVTPLDSYAWTEHAPTTLGRCPDGEGEFIANTTPSKGAPNDCRPSIVINEIESSEGVPGDWIELYNQGFAPADLSGWIIKDDDDTNIYTLPANSIIPAASFLVVDEFDLDFGLGSDDEVRLFLPDDETLVDTHSWGVHAATTLGRCPDGSGDFVETLGPTKGTANDCVGGSVAWPGRDLAVVVDAPDLFGGDLSGLSYEEGPTPADDVIWAVRNSSTRLFRLKFDGTVWNLDTADGFAAGKELAYAGGGEPDAEGVTRADYGSPTIYVASERNNDASGVSRSSVLRYSITGAATALVASAEWDLTPDLPTTGSNQGVEAITWLPDDMLTAQGFYDENLEKTYAPADYEGHGTGLFLVGLEATGELYAYAFYEDASYDRVATIATGRPLVNALELDREVGYLWTYCGASCANRATVLTIDTEPTSPTAGRFIVRTEFRAPLTLTATENEGIALAPESRCDGTDQKPFYFADDAATDDFSLRADTIPCGSFLP